MNSPREKWHRYLDPYAGMWTFSVLLACSYFSQRSTNLWPEAITFDRYVLLLALAVFEFPSIRRSFWMISIIRRGEIPRWGRVTSQALVAHAASHLPWV